MHKRKERNVNEAVPEKARNDSEKSKKKRSAKGILLRVLDILCIVSGIFCLVNYAPYFVFHLIKLHIMDLVAALLVLLFVLLPFFLRKPLKKLLKKAYTPLKIVWCAVMTLYIVSFFIFSAVIFSVDDLPAEDGQKPTVVVVFGCQVSEEHGISLELKGRLDTAAKVLADYPDAICVVTGGKGKDEPCSEAYAMADYLKKQKGIDESRILLEEKSEDTVSNVRLTLELLKNKGYTPDNCSFICISSEFHTPRVSLLFRRISGLPCATVSSKTPLRFNLFLYTVREYMSYVRLLVFGM